MTAQLFPVSMVDSLLTAQWQNNFTNIAGGTQERLVIRNPTQRRSLTAKAVFWFPAILFQLHTEPLLDHLMCVTSQDWEG